MRSSLEIALLPGGFGLWRIFGKSRFAGPPLLSGKMLARLSNAIQGRALLTGTLNFQSYMVRSMCLLICVFFFVANACSKKNRHVV